MVATKKKQYLDHIIKNLPHKPGVYKFKDKEGTVLYVGKAKDLRNRVGSYFQSSRDQSMKTRKMVEQIEDIEYTVVGSDLEAVMLETNIIKELRPKYNVLMKDDKNYVYIKITVNEDFPRIFITRQIEKDKARYFGPKTAKHKVQKTLKVLKRIFPYRHCSLAIDYNGPKKASTDPRRKHDVKVTKASIKYPCIDYHIKRCIGPCIGTVNKEEYRAVIDQVIRFLEGKHDEVIAQLKADMHKAAAEKRFEVAASIRDKLQAVEDIMEDQRISTPDQKDMDVINYVTADEKIFYNLFQVRSGKLINQENFEAKAKDEDPQKEHDPEALESFLEQYYQKATDIPQEVLIPEEIENPDTLEKLLSEVRGSKVKIITPKKGRKDKLLQLSHQNARSFARQSKVKWQGHEKSGREEALKELQKLLSLDKPPKRLECFDVSHFSGTQTVSSMVVFENGFPKKADYRKFKLSQEGSPDDYASMEETLLRRLKYLKPSIEATQYKVLKAKKKELQELKAKKNRLYFTLHKNKKQIGHACIFEAPNKKFLIEEIKIEGSSDLRILIKKIAEKVKTRRIYLSVPATAVKTYEAKGCQLIAKIPDAFKPPASRTILVYDAAKQAVDSSFRKAPDLIVIDGGKGQLGAALKALKTYQLALPTIAIAKKQEEIFVPGKANPIHLEKDDPTLHLIQHIRNESHRFAITYHQGLQLKASKSSALDTIYGIGETTKMKLLQHFGSPEAVKNATLYELEQIVGKKNAIKVKEALN